MPRKVGIAYTYAITRIATGQRYIGVTIEPDTRWAMHRWSAGRSPQLIHKALAKYGADAFTFEILACSRTWKDAALIERQLIAQYGTHVSDGGYNLTLGGEGPYGRVCSLETRAKLSRSRKGKGHRIPAAQKEVHRRHTLAMYRDHPELRLELGRRATAARVRNGHNGVGRKNSEETLERMRVAALERWSKTTLGDRKSHMDRAVSASIASRSARNEARDIQMVEMRISGATLAEIGQKYGITKQAVRDALLKRMGDKYHARSAVPPT